MAKSNRNITTKDMYARARSDGDCWLWTGYTSRDGYGRLMYERKCYRAHRFILFLLGTITGSELRKPTGVVMHTCDKPLCINPTHLRWGSVKDNVADRVRKGRGAIGEKNYGAKLCTDDVHFIRALAANGWTNKEIAEVFCDTGVTASGIKQVATRQSWKHI